MGNYQSSLNMAIVNKGLNIKYNSYNNKADIRHGLNLGKSN